MQSGIGIKIKSGWQEHHRNSRKAPGHWNGKDNLSANTAEELGQHDRGKDESEMLPHTMENIWAKIIYLLEENIRQYLHNLG